MARESFAEARRKLDRLRALRSSPGAAAVYAAELLETETLEDVLLSVLAVLRENPGPALHDVVVRRYREFDANAKRRDPLGTVRTALLSLLRREITQGDREIVLRAVTTYESGFSGPTSTSIRAAGLICLADLDPELAALYAARCTGESDADKTLGDDGEPIVTALRVLFTTNQVAAIYGYAVAAPIPAKRDGRQITEPHAEAVRLLRELPDGLASAVAARFMGSESDLILLGVCDLLVGHEGGPGVMRELRAMLQRPGDHEIFQYLAAAIVASRRDDSLAALITHGLEEGDRTKAAIVRDALLLTRNPAALAALPALEARVASLPVVRMSATPPSS